MAKIKIYVFGNPDLKEDNLPLRILPELRDKFPNFEFEVKDPNEEWQMPENGELVAIDTAIGISDVEIFEDLKKFKPAPRVSMHDFDALANLRYLQKLGKLKKIKIIALPPHLGERKAIKGVTVVIREVFR